MTGMTAHIADLFSTEHLRLLRLIARVVRCRTAAEDLVQDVFVNLLGGPARRIDNPRHYLARAATNLAIDHLRRERVRTARMAEGLTGDEPDAAPLPDAVLQGRQELALLRTAVDRLPPRCRAVFLLSREHGLTMREIAAKLDLSEKTVEKHIGRALVELRRELAAAGRTF
ncbi:RNA polymerase sigma factor [Terrihabitans sp. B22-R8]|uniref:RNA polymerase sigma factor n=1 Tax=Terrihabitans sp. B22-R8 TaxID=3425128 RepID=UPI00403C0B4D